MMHTQIKRQQYAIVTQCQKVPGNYFADWSSQSSLGASDILTAELYPMTMGMIEWMWLATNYLMDRRQM